MASIVGERVNPRLESQYRNAFSLRTLLPFLSPVPIPVPPSLVKPTTTTSTVASTSATPTGYVLVAREGQVRHFSVPTNIAYGANGKYIYLPAVTGDVTFDNITFGNP